MKKILLATTVLAFSAGFAAAEVSLSGNARMGVVYDGTDAQFSTRARVIFTLSGETDGGLAFGASFRADQADEANASGGVLGTDGGTDGTVFISGTFGKLEMGDIVSAAEAAFGDFSAVGYTGLGDFSDILYLTGDDANTDQGPNVLYSYNAGAFGFYASLSDGTIGVFDTGVETDVAYSVAATYSADVFGAGLAYSEFGDASQITIGGNATFGDATIKANYSDFEDTALGGVILEKSYGLSLDYTFGATTLTGFAHRQEFDVAVGDDNADSFGIGAAYDLGGGAAVKGGVVDTDYLDDTIADLGMTFTF